jgi:hypothetical protein
MTGSDVTVSDVIFPRFFLTIVVVQNVPLLFVIRFTASDYSFGIFWSLCCLSFDWRLPIIPLVSSRFSCKGTFCTTTIVKKKCGKIKSLPITWLTSLPVTSLPVTSFSVTSLPVAHLFQIMMVYRSSNQSSTDQIPNMPPPPPPPPPPQYSRSNDEEPYYILKTNNPFLFWKPLYCNVFYVI